MKPVLLSCLFLLPGIVQAEPTPGSSKTVPSQTESKKVSPWQRVTAAPGATVYSYEKEGVSTPMPWLGDPGKDGMRSPNKRWIHVDTREGLYQLDGSGAYPLDLPEAALLKGEGFLGDYRLVRRREAEDWKPLKNEEHRHFHDQLLCAAITQPTGPLPGATPEAAKEKLQQLRESKDSTAQTMLKELEQSVVPAMDENYSEKIFPISRRWAGWSDGSTGVYWDAMALEQGSTCQPVVQLVNYRTRTILLYSVTLPQCRRFRALTPGARAKHFFTKPVPGEAKSGEAQAFQVVLTDVQYPDAVRELVHADLKKFIELQPTPEAKEKITKLVKEAREKIPHEQLPY